MANLNILIHNVKSLAKYIDDVVLRNDGINNNIIGFIETQINLSDTPCNVIKTVNFFNINFHGNKNSFLTLAYGCRSDIAVLDKSDANGGFIFSFKKHHFPNKVFILILVYFLR